MLYKDIVFELLTLQKSWSIH